MEQKDEELLLKDLCARLPYVVFMTNKKLQETYYPLSCDDLRDAMFDVEWDDVPYLRPMSSMTEEECKYCVEHFGIQSTLLIGAQKGMIMPMEASPMFIDWLNAHHFDYRGLIEKGLAIEAPDGMYK